MDAAQLAQLRAEADRAGGRYYEFLREPSMSMGLYRLRAGDKDMQSPHKQDEVYYVLAGKAKLRVEDRVYDAIAGSVLFVAALEAHKFIEIEEHLELLVFFAPAEEG
jgi:mannose-6-phosphate isomerase-like protein (cupin superfamily)